MRGDMYRHPVDDAGEYTSPEPKQDVVPATNIAVGGMEDRALKAVVEDLRAKFARLDKHVRQLQSEVVLLKKKNDALTAALDTKITRRSPR